MSKIRVAIVGVGNCASSLVQGVTHYADAEPTDTVGGLMHVQFGDYHVSDIEFVAAFDVDAAKIGLDRGIGGPLLSPSSFFMKSPPEQRHDEDAMASTEDFIAGRVER